MNDLIKNPIVVFIAGFIALWLLFAFLKVVVNLFWLILLVFVILYFVNPRFKSIVTRIINIILKKID